MITERCAIEANKKLTELGFLFINGEWIEPKSKPISLSDALNILNDTIGVSHDHAFEMSDSIDSLLATCHQAARHSGWWKEYDEMPEQYRKYFIGSKIGLIHSEVSEMLEGFRKNLMDDHLHDMSMFQVEAADVVIRLFDLLGAMGVNIGDVMLRKLGYNQRRPDHKPENRARGQAGDKSI